MKLKKKELLLIGALIIAVAAVVILGITVSQKERQSTQDVGVERGLSGIESSPIPTATPLPQASSMDVMAVSVGDNTITIPRVTVSGLGYIEILRLASDGKTKLLGSGAQFTGSKTDVVIQLNDFVKKDEELRAVLYVQVPATEVRQAESKSGWVFEPQINKPIPLVKPAVGAPNSTP